MEIELDGKCVIHKTFGKGVVLDFDGSYLEVANIVITKRYRQQRNVEIILIIHVTIFN